jgi:hypothetical protein
MRNFIPLLVGSASLVWATAAWAIKHNSPAEVTRHPEAVLITAKDVNPPRTSFSCGVLLSPEVVLTTAHGVAGYKTWEVTAPYARRETRQAGVKTVRIHSDYKLGNAENDLAILILDRPIKIEGDWPALPGAALYPLETPVLVLGRVVDGQISPQQLFEAPATLVEVRGDTNIYGGHPQLCEHGDSGGPIYLTRRDHQLVGLMCGSLGFTRANVPTDIYVPLGGRNREWLLTHLPRQKP